MRPSSSQPSGRARVLILLVAAGLALAFALITGVMLYEARVAARTQAIQQADNIASALQRDLERDVETLDLALRGAAAGALLLEKNTLPVNLQRAILFGGSPSSNDFGAMFIVNAEGKVTLDSASETPRPFDYSNRPFFLAHRDDPGIGLLLTLVTHGQVTNLPALVLSRRISRADGSFAGVAATALRLSRFTELFGSLALSPRDDVVAVSSEGSVIYRRLSGTRYFGADRRASKVFQATRDQPAMIVEAHSQTDGVLRIYAHHRLRNVGMEIDVGLAVEDVYASWRQEAWIIGVMVVALVFLALLLLLCVHREWSRRERAELAARASESDLRLLTEHGGDMVCRVGPDGERRYVSPASTRLIGRPPGELLGKAISDLVDPADRPIIAASSMRMLTGTSAAEIINFRIRHNDGRERWIEAVASTLWDPVTGALDGFVSAWRDVTDRKRAEVLLAESEARYRLLADNATDVITCLDMNLRRTYVSPASVRVLGFEPAELLGICPPDAVHQDDASHVRRSLDCLVTGAAERVVLTNRLRHKDGHFVWVEAHLSLVRDTATAEPFSILCMIRDISARKAAADELETANGELQRLSRHLARARDAAEQASRAKSRFLASVSHELRTPLNGLLGYAELFRLDGGLSETQTKRLEAMLAAGRHLRDMVTSVLDLSEIETGKVELRPSAVALLPFAGECLDLVRTSADAKGLALSVRTGPGVPQEIKTDPKRLRQILLNLLANAVKFTDRGAVSLVLSAVGQGLRIEVVDTGPGIPPAQRDRLFQDFDRLGIDAFRSVEGAGLGLALSHRLAMALGGMLDHEDNPVGGSIFSLDLPGCQVEDAPPALLAELPAAANLAAPVRRWRALVVDDVEINRDIAASFLRAAGHDVACAEGGQEGVTAAAEGDFDVILMDVRMPEVDGLEATRRIRQLHGARGKVPVVALTAQVFADEVAACRAAGMDDHLAKPFSPVALLEVIAGAIRRSSEGQPGLNDRAPEAPAIPQLALAGADLPTLDLTALEQTAAHLPEGRRASHLRSLADRTSALLEHVRANERGADPAAVRSLAAAAHALSGSAGMFGFLRLAAVTRQFEHAVARGSSDCTLTASLIAACQAALAEMQRQVAEPADSEMAVAAL